MPDPAFAIDATIRSASLTSVPSNEKMESVASRMALAVVWSMPVHMFLNRLTRPGSVVGSGAPCFQFSNCSAYSCSSSLPGASMPAIGRGSAMSYGCSTPGLVCIQNADLAATKSGTLKAPVSASKYELTSRCWWHTFSGVESKSTSPASRAAWRFALKTYSGERYESPPYFLTPLSGWLSAPSGRSLRQIGG